MLQKLVELVGKLIINNVTLGIFNGRDINWVDIALSSVIILTFEMKHTVVFILAQISIPYTNHLTRIKLSCEIWVVRNNLEVAFFGTSLGTLVICTGECEGGVKRARARERAALTDRNPTFWGFEHVDETLIFYVNKRALNEVHRRDYI